MRGSIRMVMALFCIILLLQMSYFPAVSEETFRQKIGSLLYTKLDESLEAAIYFASELNISNGEPYIRTGDGGFGERHMFGKLLSVYTADAWIGTATDEDINRAIEEVHRLLTGKLKAPGETGYLLEKVSYGRVLDLDLGDWVRFKQSNSSAIKVIHKTEYYGRTRYAHLIEYNGYLTLWRSDPKTSQ